MVNDVVEAIRSGRDPTMDFRRILGLVSFPSFHAGAALLLAVATRKLPFGLWLPFLVANAMMIVGTITEGGHNLTDVVGGCALAVLSIFVGQALQRSPISSRLRAGAFWRKPSRIIAGAASAPSEHAS